MSGFFLMLPGRNDDSYFNCGGTVNYDPVIYLYPNGIQVTTGLDWNTMTAYNNANSQTWCNTQQFTSHAIFAKMSYLQPYIDNCSFNAVRALADDRAGDVTEWKSSGDFFLDLLMEMNDMTMAVPPPVPTTPAPRPLDPLEIEYFMN